VHAKLWRLNKKYKRKKKMENLKIVKQEWKSGVGKDTGKAWTGLEVTLQGSEKFTVSKLIFLNDTQKQLLGLEAPKN